MQAISTEASISVIRNTNHIITMSTEDIKMPLIKYLFCFKTRFYLLL